MQTEPVAGESPSGPIVLSGEEIERIVDAVEERVLEELERRGLRFNPGVF